MHGAEQGRERSVGEEVVEGATLVGLPRIVDVVVEGHVLVAQACPYGTEG